MKRKSLIVFILFILANNTFAQSKTASPFTGRWVNTQYEYFKNHTQSEEILFHISPWSLYIDSSGKCTVELIYEQQSDIGYPVSKEKLLNKEWIYHYKKNYDVWLYTVKDNDSLLIYSNGITPGAGIIFKRYAGDINKQ